MNPMLVRNLASIVGLAILVELIAYAGKVTVMLSGVLYLLAANCVCIICVICATRLRRKSVDNREANSQFYLRQMRAHFLLFVACQLAVVGTLNASSVISSRSWFTFLLDYCVMLLFFCVSYRLLAIADSNDQSGGYIPFNFLGFPRSRRFLFLVFAGYCTIAPLTVMTIEVTAVADRWHPEVVEAPQACLLMTSIMATMCWGFLARRYTAEGVKSSRNHMFFVGTLLFIASTGLLQYMLSLSFYTYGLSSLATAAIAASLWYLWRAGDSISSGETRGG